ncbi:MAG: ParA family protein [bacterium]
MPMIMMLNLKGGVAKTTNTIAIAEYLASLGKKVLVIDADHQSLAGELLLGQERLLHAESHRKTLHDLLAFMLSDEFTPEAVDTYITHNVSNVRNIREYLDCVACSHRIDEFSTNMARARRGHQSNREFMIRLNRLRCGFTRWCNNHYDYTLIDCPPSFAIQIQFLLASAEYFIVPSIPDRLSVRGSLYLLERIRMRGYTRIQCLGTLWSMVRVQIRNHTDIIKMAKNRVAEYAALPRPFETSIPNMAAIAEAMDSQREFPHFRAKYQTQASNLYRDLCMEIMKRINAPAQD